MPPRQSIRASLKEGFPAICVVSLLSMIAGEFDHYKWLSPNTTLYMWTLIWVAATVCCLRFFRLPVSGPLMIACHGFMKNFSMLWDMYGMIGEQRCGCASITAREVVCAGVFSAVAVGGSYYVTTRVSMRRAREDEAEDGGWAEKEGDGKA